MKRKQATALDDLFPEASAATVPTSLRFSAALLDRIDSIAKERKMTRTETIERLLRHALATLQPDESLEELQARRRRSGDVRFSMGKKR